MVLFKQHLPKQIAGAILIIAVSGFAGVEFPGPLPGQAKSSQAGGVFTLENAVISESWQAAGRRTSSAAVDQQTDRKTVRSVRRGIISPGVDAAQEAKGRCRGRAVGGGTGRGARLPRRFGVDGTGRISARGISRRAEAGAPRQDELAGGGKRIILAILARRASASFQTSIWQRRCRLRRNLN